MSIVSLKHYKDIKSSQIKDIKDKNYRIRVHYNDKLLQIILTGWLDTW